MACTITDYGLLAIAALAGFAAGGSFAFLIGWVEFRRASLAWFRPEPLWRSTTTRKVCGVSDANQEHFDAAFARMDEAFDEMHKAFAAAKGDAK